MRMNISVPDELAEQVRAHDLPISAICQEALRKAVERARLQEKAMNDIEAVAARLRGTAVEANQDKHDEGYDDGVRWAKQYATRDDLSYMSSSGYDADSEELLQLPSLVDYIGAKHHLNLTSVRVDHSDPYWQGFIRGAGEVWEAVEALI